MCVRSAVTSSFLSSFQSPMSKSCDTIRAPGFSPFWSTGIRRRLTSGSRYSVTTSTSLKSSAVIFSTSPCLKVSAFVCASVSFASFTALVAVLEPLGVEVDAEPSLGLEVLDGGDDDPAVAAAEVVDRLAFLHGGELQHRGHDLLVGRHVRHVDLDLQFLLSSSCPGRRGADRLRPPAIATVRANANDLPHGEYLRGVRNGRIGQGGLCSWSSH